MEEVGEREEKVDDFFILPEMRDMANEEIENLLCGKDREDAKERTIALLTFALLSDNRGERPSARIRSDELAKTALRYLREKYNFTDEENDKLVKEVIRKYYLLRICFPFVVEREGYRIYFPDERTFRQYLRLEQQRQQQQSAAQSQKRKKKRQKRQQQQHNSQSSQTSQTTLSEFEARELIKQARSILDGY